VGWLKGKLVHFDIIGNIPGKVKPIKKLKFK